MRFFLHLLFVLFIVSAFSTCKNKPSQEVEAVPDSLLIEPDSLNRNYLDSNFIHSFIDQHTLFSRQSSNIFNFYVKRNFQYAWFDNDGLIEQARNFENLLNNFSPEGMEDSVVFKARLNSWYNHFNDSTITIDSLSPYLEVMLTAQFFQYAWRIWGGILEQQTKDLDWYIKRKRLPYESLLDSMLNVADFFMSNTPVYPQYDSLRNQLQYYHNLQLKVKWDSIKTTVKTYKKGDQDSVILLIKKRLFWLKDLAALDTANDEFDESMMKGVKVFQLSHGLAPTGTIGKQTLQHLNIPIASRIEQIIVNMERCRWVPVQPEGDYITVNIPEFVMRVYASDTLAWQCNVVVGNNSNQTVIFNGDLKYVVFSPYWSVPRSIIAKEILPGCRRNQDYIQTHNMEVVGASGKVKDPDSIHWNKYTGKTFPYSVRQKPGANNSLGKVKFLFPNEHSIYLHDTPAKSLFNESKRNFSHGCIRVSEPEKLAEFLLRNDSIWTPEKISSAMEENKEVYVMLQQEVPVFIGYLTCFVDANGILNFRDDVYGHDSRLAKSLFSDPVL